MEAKYFIVQILIVAFVATISAPPAHAELVTLTVVLAAAFATAVIVDKVVDSENDTGNASKADEPDKKKRSGVRRPTIESRPSDQFPYSGYRVVSVTGFAPPTAAVEFAAE